METKQADSIAATTMAIREVLMEYFKGTCIERLTEGAEIRLAPLPRTGSFRYQQREAENQRASEISLGGFPIMTVRRAPEQVVFHAKVLNRSPQLREVYKGLREFMDKYLAGIEVKHSRKGVFYAN